MPICVILLLIDMVTLMLYAFFGSYIKLWLGEDVFVWGYVIALVAPICILGIIGSVPVVRIDSEYEINRNNKEGK